MKRVFWALVHTFSAILITSGLYSYFSVPVIPAQAVTSVKSSVTFPTRSGLPNPNDILSAVNATRIQNSQTVLRGDAVLSQLAEERADDMVARSYYAHKNPDGNNFFNLLQQKNAEPAYACENLNLQSSLEAYDYAKDWYASTKGHRECMLNPNVTRAGYAVRAMYETASSGGLYQTYYVVVAIHATDN